MRIYIIELETLLERDALVEFALEPEEYNLLLLNVYEYQNS